MKSNFISTVGTIFMLWMFSTSIFAIILDDNAPTHIFIIGVLSLGVIAFLASFIWSRRHKGEKMFSLNSDKYELTSADHSTDIIRLIIGITLGIEYLREIISDCVKPGTTLIAAYTDFALFTLALFVAITSGLSIKHYMDRYTLMKDTIDSLTDVIEKAKDSSSDSESVDKKESEA